jgi:PKD repeat protein
MKTLFIALILLLSCSFAFAANIDINISCAPRTCGHFGMYSDYNSFHVTIAVNDYSLASGHTYRLGVQYDPAHMSFYETALEDYNGFRMFDAGDCPISCFSDFHLRFDPCYYPQFGTNGEVLPVQQNFALYDYNGTTYTLISGSNLEWNINQTYQEINYNVTNVNPTVAANYPIDYYRLVEHSVSPYETQHNNVKAQSEETVKRRIYLLNTGTIPFDGVLNFEDENTCEVAQLVNVDLLKLDFGSSPTTASSILTSLITDNPFQVDFYNDIASTDWIDGAPGNELLVIEETYYIPHDESGCIWQCRIDGDHSTISYSWGCCPEQDNNSSNKNYYMTEHGDPQMRWDMILPEENPFIYLAPDGTHWCNSYYDNEAGCAYINWKYTLTNVVSTNATLNAPAYHVQIQLGNIPNALVVIDYSTLSCSYTHGSTTVPLTAHSQVYSQLECAASIDGVLGVLFGSINPFDPHYNDIPVLYSGDYVTVEYQTKVCCPTLADYNYLIGSPISLNQISLSERYVDQCHPHGGGLGASGSSNGCYPGTGSNSWNEDVVLTQTLTPAVSNLINSGSGCVSTYSGPNDIEVDNSVFNLNNEDATFFCSTYNINASQMEVNAGTQVGVRIRMRESLTLDLSGANPIYIRKGNDFWYAVNAGSITNTGPAQGCNSSDCENERWYEAFFDISDLPGGRTLTALRSFINGSHIGFGLLPCCCGCPDLNTPYWVETFIETNCDGNGTCRIPLNRIGNFINVQCPGCVFPGIQINSTTLEREKNGTLNSYGFEDAQNDGLKDNSVQINLSNTGTPYSHALDVKTNRSIQGDVITANVWGSYFAGNYGALMGLDCQSCTTPWRFNYLYFDQHIPYSELAKFNLVLISTDIYFDAHNPVTDPPDLHFDETSTLVDDVNSFHAAATAGTREANQFLFRFTPQDLGISEFSPFGNYADDANGFSNIRVINKYRICSNYIDPGLPYVTYYDYAVPSLSPNLNRFESAMFSDYYFSFIEQTEPDYNVLPQAGGDPGGCALPLTTDDCSCLCDKIFQCGAGGALHYFYSKRTANISRISDETANSDCTKQITCRAISCIGGLINGAQALNVFPYEFRPAPTLQSFDITYPTGYITLPGSESSAYTAFTTYVCSVPEGRSTGITYSVPVSEGSYMIPAVDAEQALASSPFTCTPSWYTVTSSPPFNGNMRNGDEYTFTRIDYFAIPDCEETEPSVSIEGDWIKAVFDNNNCSSSSAQVIPLAVPPGSALTMPDPEMSMIMTSSTSVTSHIVTKEFQLTITSATGDVADNCFLYFPDPDQAGYRFVSASIGSSVVTDRIWKLADHIGGIHTFSMTFEINSCPGPEVKIKYGWACNPSDLNLTNLESGNVCYINSVVADFDYQPWLINCETEVFTLDETHSSEYGLCNEAHFKTTLTAIDFGQVQNIHIYVNPNGMQFNTASFNYFLPDNLCEGTIPVTPTGNDILDFAFPFSSTACSPGFEAPEKIELEFSMTPQCCYSGTAPIIKYSFDSYCMENETGQCNPSTWSHNVSLDECTPECVCITTSALCDGNSSVLIATATGGTGNYDYIWSPGGGVTSTITVTAPDTYTVTVTDGNRTVTATVDAVFAPNVTIANCPESEILCNRDYQFEPSDFGYDYSWTFGDGGTSTDPYGLHSYAATGTYTVTLTTTIPGYPSCASTTTCTVEVGLPNISIICPSEQILCQEPFQFSANVSCTEPAYFWEFDDAITSTEASPYHVFTTDGSHTVTLTVTCGSESSCSQTTDCVIDVECPEMDCSFCTYTMEGWGSSSSATEPQPILASDFYDVFPNNIGNLTFGCLSGKWIQLTSPENVRCFLPSGGTQNTQVPLNTSYVNPYCSPPNPSSQCRTSSNENVRNSLIAETATLNLNVYFDLRDPDFNPSSYHLANLTIVGNPVSQPLFYGMRVFDVLDLANNYIGGCSQLPTGITAADLHAALHQINVSFEHCHHSQHGQMYDCGQMTNNGRLVGDDLSAHVEPINGSCMNDYSSVIIGSAIGGYPPYTYSWSNGSNEKTIDRLEDGSYTLTVTDFFGNTSTAETSVSSEQICCEAENGQFPQFPDATNVRDNSFYSVNYPPSVEVGFYESLTLRNVHFNVSEGVVLVVHGGVTLTLDNCVFEACGNMWKGIVIEKDAVLNVTDCHINDAEYAIYAKDGSRLIVKGSYFKNDVVGIKSEPNDAGSINDISFQVTGCEFVRSGSLHGLYIGQSPHGEYPKAGIEFNNMNGWIGNDENETNFFHNLNCGIIAHNSSLEIQNCKFTSIHNEEFYTDAYMGSAIASTGEDMNFWACIHPYVEQLPASPTFFQCDYGFYGDLGKFRIRDCYMDQMETGIYQTRCAVSGGINITDCFITASQAGILLEENEGSGGILIFGNTITATGSDGKCISAYESGSGENNLEIRQNNFSCAGSLSAIELINCYDPNIYSNLIQEASPGREGFVGIDLNGCESPNVSCNTIAGLDADETHGSSAINFNLTTGGTLLCNVVDNTTEGIAFYGPSPTHILGNEMNNHFEGLYLNDNAVISDQDHHGNRWLGDFSSGYGANNENYTGSGLDDSKFAVHCTTGASCIYNPVVPSYDDSWFDVQTGFTPYSCAAITAADCEGQSAGSGERSSLELSSSLDYHIAEDYPLSAVYMHETKSIAKQYLYDKLTHLPSLRTEGSSLASFYRVNSEISIGRLQQVKDAIRELNHFSSDYSNQLDSLNNGMQLISDTIAILDYLTLSHPAEASQYYQHQSALRMRATALQTTALSLRVQMERLKTNSAANILYANAAIAPVEIPEQNEKIINEVYLQTIGSGIYSLEEYLAESVLAVAEQCPYSGGKSVYRARALYRLYDSQKQFNDEFACKSTSSNQQGVRTNEINLVPNPAAERVAVYYSSSQGVCNLQILELTGKLIKNVSLPCDKKVYEFSVYELTEGIYFVSVSNNDHLIGRKKLIVTR